MTMHADEKLKHQPAVVSHQEWVESRVKLLAKEKELTRLYDQLSEERRQLPWKQVTQNYTFNTPGGKITLSELFGGRSQLVVYHFMFGPDWQEGCPSCSFVSDHISDCLPHLAARDVSVVAISRAPIAKLEAFKKRMGWKFKWVSSSDSDFNFDYNVSFSPEQHSAGKVEYNYKLEEFPSQEAPGLSVFYKDSAGNIFHTYSTYGRGVELLMTTYRVLDVVPKGRDEDQLNFGMEWVRYHDQYDTNVFADADKPYWPQL